MKTFQISVCENDDRGRRMSSVSRIGFCLDSDFLDLESINMGGIYFEFKISGEERYIEMTSGKYPVISWNDWAGNLHWNVYTMSIPDGLQLLNDLISSHQWNVMSVDSILYPKISRFEQITCEDLGLDPNVYMKDPNQLSLF